MIRITQEMVGKALGVSPQAVRVGIQQGKLNLGYSYKKNPDDKRQAYVIFPEAARQMLGDERYNKMLSLAQRAS